MICGTIYEIDANYKGNSFLNCWNPSTLFGVVGKFWDVGIPHSYKLTHCKSKGGGYFRAVFLNPWSGRKCVLHCDPVQLTCTHLLHKCAKQLTTYLYFVQYILISVLVHCFFNARNKFSLLPIKWISKPTSALHLQFDKLCLGYSLILAFKFLLTLYNYICIHVLYYIVSCGNRW